MTSPHVQPIIFQAFPPRTETLSLRSLQAGSGKGRTEGVEPTYCDAADDGGTHKVAALVTLDLDLSAVQQQLGSLVDAALDQAAHPLLGLGGDQRANICAGLVSCKGPKSPALRGCALWHLPDVRRFGALTFHMPPLPQAHESPVEGHPEALPHKWILWAFRGPARQIRVGEQRAKRRHLAARHLFSQGT